MIAVAGFGLVAGRIAIVVYFGSLVGRELVSSVGLVVCMCSLLLVLEA